MSKPKNNNCDLVVSDSGRLQAFISVEKSDEFLDSNVQCATEFDSAVVENDFEEDEFYTHQPLNYQYSNNRYTNGFFNDFN